MGKNKYRYCIDDPDYDAKKVKVKVNDSRDSVPKKMLLDRCDPGVSLGMKTGCGPQKYVGIRQGTEGNIIVVGGNGSGKSSGIAKPTLMTWRGSMCVTDIKGELSDFYAEQYRKGFVTRPFIICDFTQPDGPSYDPFWWLLQDDSHRLVNNVHELALAIVPPRPDEKEPFWTETERGVLVAALLYYFQLGLSFSEAMCVISRQPLSSLCKKLSESDDSHIQNYLGEMADMKGETLASVDRGLRNKIMLFANDQYISHVFRGSREGANCFTWEDLDTHNIFLRIPAYRIEQWSGAVNLIYTQLIRYLERRPEMHSLEGANNVQTLLLMDEFARFGKLEMITAAMSTLRSKNVNICLIIQSIAQLDKNYGEYDRRIIFDNCQFQAILRANDPETQKYLAEQFGTRMSLQRSISEHEDDYGGTIYTKQISEIREFAVQPHELATLDDVLLLTPYGFCRTEKIRLYGEEMQSALPAVHLYGEEIQSALPTAPEIKPVFVKATPITPEDVKPQPGIHVVARPIEDPPNISKRNEETKGAKMITIDERTQNAYKRIDAAERKRRQEERAAQEAQKKQDSRRNYIIGELVTKYFPDVTTLEPGTQNENLARFETLEAFLCVLSTDYDLCRELQERADQLLSEDPDGGWRSPE